MPNLPEEIAASVQHLELLQASISKTEGRLKKLREARADTIKQIAHAAARAVREWKAIEQLALYENLRSPGLQSAWISAGLPHPLKLKAAVGDPPNDPVSGGWVGEFDPQAIPMISGPLPGRTPVVYVLYGPDYSPVYCGSSQNLYQRLRSHRSDGKTFIAWRAVPYDSREDAYVAEDRLLKESCPPLNRKASR